MMKKKTMMFYNNVKEKWANVMPLDSRLIPMLYVEITDINKNSGPL